MTDLIFHIGLAKCASSTLQREVFCHEEGYLGTKGGLALQENFGAQFLKYGPFVGRQTTDYRGLFRWADGVRERQASCWPQAERLLLSQETLSAACRLSDRPILKILSILKEQIWREGRIRVVLILRSQANRLASSYAQNSSCMWHPGQADFERTVARYLSNRRYLRLMDYSRWIDGLNEVVGPDNVCTLLLEEAGTIDFWARLSEFCSLEKFEPSSMVHGDSSNKNVRRRAADRWAIQPLDTVLRARANTEKWLNLLWPSAVAPKARIRFKDRGMQALHSRCKRKASKIDLTRRENEIKLNRKVMETIRDKCGPGNARLAKQLGRDLTTLGY